MADYFISDTHFGHANIIKYCSRPFLSEEEARQVQEAGGDRERVRKVSVSQASVEHMDATMIDNLNAVVGPDDVLWHLGDFAFGDYEVAERYRRRIGCKTINLIWGNHDKRRIAGLFNRTFDQVLIHVEGQGIFLNHYAMRVWDKSHHGTWHLYGHSHGRLPDDPESLSVDIGVDCHDFRPWSFAEIRAVMSRKKPRAESGADVL
jgi:calcineurin-like phosphoesterase family protein